MEQVDRGRFVTGLFADRAYEDMPLPIACGQTISQPSVVGLMTQALDVRPTRYGPGSWDRLRLSGREFCRNWRDGSIRLNATGGW